MIGYTFESVRSVRDRARERYRKLANTKPTEDFTLDDIQQTMWCLSRLIAECDHELYEFKRAKRRITYDYSK